MNLARLSKKSPHADNRQTLIAMHQDKLKEFEDEYRTLPSKEQKLRQMIQQYKMKDSKNMQDLYEEICKMQKEVKKLRAREAENSYLIDASEYIKEYYAKGDPNEPEFSNEEKEYNAESDTEKKIPLETTSSLSSIVQFVSHEKGQKGQICKNYINSCLSTMSCKKHSEYISEEYTKLICKKCDAMRTIIHTEAVASCQSCGEQVPYQDMFSHQEHREEVEVLSPFAYKRINHFKEWLTQMQADEASSPSEEVIDLLLIELKKDRIDKTERITPKRIKGYLKKLRLNKQYEHIPAIIDKLCGVSPPVISRQLENKLISMFEEIQAPFEKHCPKGRKNFLSYSYTLHKMCELLDEHHLLPYFPLLKSREKLYFQDKLWEAITKTVGWKFIPSL